MVGSIPGLSEWKLFTKPANMDDIFFIDFIYWHSTLWTPGETWIFGDNWFKMRAPIKAVKASGWQKFAVKLSLGFRKAPWRWNPVKKAKFGYLLQRIKGVLLLLSTQKNRRDSQEPHFLFLKFFWVLKHFLNHFECDYCLKQESLSHTLIKDLLDQKTFLFLL